MATNIVVIEGRLGQSPELKYTPNETPIAKLSLANNRRYNGNEKTNWINVICWRKLAEIVGEYLHKGSHINVVGRLESRTWEEQNGTKRYVLEIIADDISFLDPKSGKQVQASEKTEGGVPLENEPPF